MNSFQNLVSKSADYYPGSNTCHQKCRCVYKHTCILYDQHGNDQLTDIMGNTSCNADTDQTEGGFFQHKCHNCHTKRGPCQTVQDTEQISEHKSDHQNADNRNQGSLLNEYFFKINSTPRLASPSLIPESPQNRHQ